MKRLKKLVKAKNYDKVLRIADEILEKNPDNVDVLFMAGGIHYMKGKLTKAMSYFDKVLEISSYEPDTLLLKANIFFKQGQFDDAIICCKKIKEIDPKNKAVAELLQKISEEQK